MVQVMASRMRILGLAVVLSLVGPGSARALEFASPIPEVYAAAFDVAEPQPDWLLSPYGVDFLQAGLTDGPGIAVVLDRVEQYMYEGSNGWQSTLPAGEAEFTAMATWTVSKINVPVPEDGLMLFIGGLQPVGYPPLPGAGPIPDYPLGSVQVLTGGGVLGGESFDPLAELVLSAPGIDYVYYGTRIFEVTDSIHFGYVGQNSQVDGPPALFANAGQNFVVPEPGTALLVGVGLTVMARRRAGRMRG